MPTSSARKDYFATKTLTQQRQWQNKSVDVLQCVAVRCSALQCVATHSSTSMTEQISKWIRLSNEWIDQSGWMPQSSAHKDNFSTTTLTQQRQWLNELVNFNDWMNRWMCCSVLQYVAVVCSGLQWVATRSTTSMTEWIGKCVAVCCSVLQCVAVCCSALQCVAVRCNTLNNINDWMNQCMNTSK